MFDWTRTPALRTGLALLAATSVLLLLLGRTGRYLRLA